MLNILILGAGSIGKHLENDFIDQINSEKKHSALSCGVPISINFQNLKK